MLKNKINGNHNRRAEQLMKQKKRTRYILITLSITITAVLVPSIILLVKNLSNDIEPNNSSELSSSLVNIVPSESPSNESSLNSELSSAANSLPTIGLEPTDKNYIQLSDPLLIVVNNNVPISEDYEIIPAFVNNETVDVIIYENLVAMMKAGEKEGCNFWVASGYRTVEEQEILLNRAVQKNIRDGMDRDSALALAGQTIAHAEHSEHHTGLAIDFNDVTSAFANTKEYAWLSEHAQDYGFIQRYKADKAEITGIIEESWHFRYVGVEHAKKMNELDMCLEEYVVYLKKNGVN